VSRERWFIFHVIQLNPHSASSSRMFSFLTTLCVWDDPVDILCLMDRKQNQRKKILLKILLVQKVWNPSKSWPWRWSTIKKKPCKKPVFVILQEKNKAILDYYKMTPWVLLGSKGFFEMGVREREKKYIRTTFRARQRYKFRLNESFAVEKSRLFSSRHWKKREREIKTARLNALLVGVDAVRQRRKKKYREK
jgi:hypothetical protein